MAIVNETMAKRTGRALQRSGKRVRFTDQEMWREVVGIIGDVKHWGSMAREPELYVPSSQFPTFAQTFVLLDGWQSPRTGGRSCSGMFAISIRTCRCPGPHDGGGAASSVERRKWTMSLLAVLRGVGAGAGRRGHLRRESHLVSLRTPEIGVRLTLGARPFA